MTANVPQDSILRRHYQGAQGSHAEPQDSILRRHHQAQRRGAVQSVVRPAAATAPRSTVAMPEPPPARPAPEPSPQPAATRTAPEPAPARPAVPPAAGGGFFGWLKRLLGGG